MEVELSLLLYSRWHELIEALKQIEDKNYDSPLVQDGYTDVIKYGIAFYKKDCMIKINKLSKIFC